MTNVFIPGKVILSGEHSAVYGKLALAVSLDRGVTVSINEGDFNGSPNDEKGLIEKAIELAGENKKIGVTVHSELPVGSGLGSSAAVSAAVIKAVRAYLGRPIANDELFELTMECEKIAHGTPSGVDPATVIYGGLITFTKGKGFEKLKLAKETKLLVVNTGTPSEQSREMIVEVVGKNGNKDPIINSIELVTLKIMEKLLNGDNIVEEINENGLLLEKLGVVSKSGRRLSRELRKLGYGVKISGAGGVKTGSGMMIVMGEDLEKAKKLLDNMKIDYFETTIGGK